MKIDISNLSYRNLKLFAFPLLEKKVLDCGTAKILENIQKYLPDHFITEEDNKIDQYGIVEPEDCILFKMYLISLNKSFYKDSDSDEIFGLTIRKDQTLMIISAEDLNNDKISYIYEEGKSKRFLAYRENILIKEDQNGNPFFDFKITDKDFTFEASFHRVRDLLRGKTAVFIYNKEIEKFFKEKEIKYKSNEWGIYRYCFDQKSRRRNPLITNIIQADFYFDYAFHYNDRINVIDGVDIFSGHVDFNVQFVRLIIVNL